MIRRSRQLAPGLSVLEVVQKVFDTRGLLGFFNGFGLNAARTLTGALALVAFDMMKKKLA